MDSQAMFLNCPAYLDSAGARCGLPAEVGGWYIVSSTDGPLESVTITCPRGHHLNGPVGYLTMSQPPGRAAVSASLLAPLIPRGQWPSLQRNRRPAHDLNHGGTDD